MNRNLKRIAQLAGLRDMVEVVSIEAGRVVKKQQPKHELVTMHTARHTFAVQSLMRGLPVAVLSAAKSAVAHPYSDYDAVRQDCRRLSAPGDAANLGGQWGGH